MTRRSVPLAWGLDPDRPPAARRAGPKRTSPPPPGRPAGRRSTAELLDGARHLRRVLYGTDVPHEAKRVPLAPRLRDLLAFVAIDPDPLDRLALLARRCLAHELVLEGALGAPAEDHLVVGGKRILYREREIGEGGAVARDRVLDALAVLVAENRVMVDVVVEAELVDDVEVSLAERLAEDASRRGDV